MVTEIANGLNIDFNTFPSFNRLVKYFEGILTEYKEKYNMNRYGVFQHDIETKEMLTDIEIMCYLEDKDYFEV